jgi:hypothetical protein
MTNDPIKPVGLTLEEIERLKALHNPELVPAAAHMIVTQRDEIERLRGLLREATGEKQMTEKTPFISYLTFLDALKERANYETMYKDSEGRSILVIQTADLFSFINKLLAEKNK